MKFRATIDGTELTFHIEKRGDTITVQLNRSHEDWDCVRLTPHSYSILTGGQSHHLSVTEQSDGYKVVIDQHTYQVKIKDETDLLLERFGISDVSVHSRGEVRAPIPGLISAVFVEPGQMVKRGDKLMILEAMKMENEIVSSISGEVGDVAASQGQSVEKNAILVSITPDKDGNR
ncbi:MAG: acetyl-CoA carboxylase biotin carboxyl carrier protein subunit [Candidatus Neomarinimicrobiota bacterium]